MDILPKVQSQAARIVSNVSSDQPSVEIVASLLWLPVRAGVMFEILLNVFHVVQGTAPMYLGSMLKVFRDITD